MVHGVILGWAGAGLLQGRFRRVDPYLYVGATALAYRHGGPRSACIVVPGAWECTVVLSQDEDVGVPPENHFGGSGSGPLVEIWRRFAEDVSGL